MKLHPRHEKVEKARREYEDRVLDWYIRYELTLPEQLEIQSNYLHRTLSRAVACERRQEEESR